MAARLQITLTLIVEASNGSADDVQAGVDAALDNGVQDTILDAVHDAMPFSAGSLESVDASATVEGLSPAAALDYRAIAEDFNARIDAACEILDEEGDDYDRIIGALEVLGKPAKTPKPIKPAEVCTRAADHEPGVTCSRCGHFSPNEDEELRTQLTELLGRLETGERDGAQAIDGDDSAVLAALVRAELKA